MFGSQYINNQLCWKSAITAAVKTEGKCCTQEHVQAPFFFNHLCIHNLKVREHYNKVFPILHPVFLSVSKLQIHSTEIMRNQSCKPCSIFFFALKSHLLRVMPSNRERFHHSCIVTAAVGESSHCLGRPAVNGQEACSTQSS